MAEDLGSSLAEAVAPPEQAPPQKRIYISPRRDKPEDWSPDQAVSPYKPGEAPPTTPSLAEDLSRASVLPQQPPAEQPLTLGKSTQTWQPPTGAEARPYIAPPSERITSGVQDILHAAGADNYTANNLANKLMGLVQSTPLGVPISAADTLHAKSQGDNTGVVMGMAGMIPGAKPVAKTAQTVLREALPAAKQAVQEAVPAAKQAATSIGESLADALPGAGHNMPPTGSMNPLANERVTFGGKEPRDFTPEDWQAFGQHHGVENLGPLSPLQTFKNMKGQDFALPGGTEGKWTYADLLHMKANPINPAEVDRGLHTQMQQKLGRTMTPEQPSDANTWNGLIFGMTSPNNPLFPNQATASRLRLRTPEMLDDLASMIPWKPGDTPTVQARKIVNDQIAARYGLNAASKGGLGTRGTADYSRVAEMAQLFKQNPDFFRKKQDESWTQAVERISSQLPGLSMKTGSFGTVWQDPANAAISAIDRHMARELDKRGGIFASPAERTNWENRAVSLWNTREHARQIVELKKTGEVRRPADIATDFDDLMKKQGSDGFMGEMLLDHVGKELTPKFRTAKGDINPNLPPHLAQADWVREPATVFKVGRAYKQALEVNQKIADEHGLNLFMSQWMEWDRIRNRFEPHENMFPGLEKTPAMSVEQMRAVDQAHKETGHKTYNKTPEGSLRPTRPLQGSASKLGYLGLGTAMAGPALMKEEGKDTAD